MRELTIISQWFDATPDPPLEAEQEALRRLTDAIRAEAAPAPRGIRHVPRRWPLRAALLAAVGAAVAVIAQVVPPAEEGRTPSVYVLGSPEPAAAAAATKSCFQQRVDTTGCLEAVAGVAGSLDLVALDKVYYLQTTTPLEGGATVTPEHPKGVKGVTRTFNVGVSSVTEIWVTGDGSLYTATKPGRAFPETVRDLELWRESGSPDISPLLSLVHSFQPDLKGTAEGYFLGMEGGLYKALEHVVGPNPTGALPTDAEALGRVIDQAAWWEMYGNDREPPCEQDLRDCPLETRRRIMSMGNDRLPQLLRYPFISPQVRAATLKLIGRRPGAKALGRLADPRGREGVAIALPYVDHAGIRPITAPGTHVLVVDPRTGLLIGDANVVGPGSEMRVTNVYQPLDISLKGREETLHLLWGFFYDARNGVVDDVGDVPAR